MGTCKIARDGLRSLPSAVRPARREQRGGSLRRRGVENVRQTETGRERERERRRQRETGTERGTKSRGSASAEEGAACVERTVTMRRAACTPPP